MLLSHSDTKQKSSKNKLIKAIIFILHFAEMLPIWTGVLLELIVDIVTDVVAVVLLDVIRFPRMVVFTSIDDEVSCEIPELMSLTKASAVVDKMVNVVVPSEIVVRVFVPKGSLEADPRFIVSVSLCIFVVIPVRSDSAVDVVIFVAVNICVAVSVLVTNDSLVMNIKDPVLLLSSVGIIVIRLDSNSVVVDDEVIKSVSLSDIMFLSLLNDSLVVDLTVTVLVPSRVVLSRSDSTVEDALVVLSMSS